MNAKSRSDRKQRKRLTIGGGTAIAMAVAATMLWSNFSGMHSANAAAKVDVPRSLADDGRIGKISDVQGIVLLRPLLAERWTPVCGPTLLKPGDWIRTDIRGANAVAIRLSSDATLTLGPGTLVECISPLQARIHSGEMQVEIPKPVAPAKAAAGDGPKASSPKFKLLAPRSGGREFSSPGKTFLRVDRNEQLAEVKELPKWLAGFEGTTANDPLGSLIVKLPDGRNEPLSVGYHHVNVEIRDQIARTTIEESFVNHTRERLEGVFTFPLPQDASISDFGMWIGGTLVEADIVEKQRAREIYETIKRERRDPGLLEWTSGNLFKARVFPIEPNSEKRVKIVYTQVLPLRGNTYRYVYGLRSDLLRLRPVRELSIQVTVNSAIPLKNVTCPTHSVRTQQTEHSATVEFAAQEYSPERDFEVDCQIDGHTPEIVVVPHRRGSDGYLLVQLMPPAPEGNWQRDALPNGPPLDLVLLCDTSASMDLEKRREQAEFVATVLSSLGEKDRFMLAACDVATVWAAPEPLAPTAGNISRARDFLANRASLGWTDLDQAFAAVLQKSPAGAQIVYIGDGIVTAGDRDPAAFVRRLAKMIADQKITNKSAAYTLHSVAVGNVGEATVLKGIATVGGGSTRSIGGTETPQTVAREWLGEIARPGLRDLAVEFRGVKVAAMYPERLPNVAAGTQQILVGRYLPTGAGNDAQRGEIVVTGTLAGKPIRYSAHIDFQNAEQGNSFIPRLWARRQLDFLLAQGRNPAVRDDIIALSEQFHIITPYTSLLVLETDADRERFGVRRHFAMRDGERFFAQGKANANFELAQQQIRRAADWRLGLRRQILSRLQSLGRDSRAVQSWARRLQPPLSDGSIDNPIGLDEIGMIWRSRKDRDPVRLNFNTYHGAWDFGLINGGFSESRGGGNADFDSLIGLITTTVEPGTWDSNGGAGSIAPFSSNLTLVVSQTQEIHERISDIQSFPGLIADINRIGFDESGLTPAFDRVRIPQGPLYIEDPSSIDAVKVLASPRIIIQESEENQLGVQTDPFAFDATFNPRSLLTLDSFNLPLPSPYYLSNNVQYSLPGPWFKLNESANGYIDYKGARPWAAGGWPPAGWPRALFPPVAEPARTPLAPANKPKSWSPDAIALSKSLLRLDSLQKLNGGIELRTVANAMFDPIWNRTVWQNAGLALYSPRGWLIKPIDRTQQTVVHYCDKKERGVFSLALLLGQTRPPVARDFSMPPFNLYDNSLVPLYDDYRDWRARVEKAGDHRQSLILSARNSTYETRYLIDTARHILLQRESFSDGKSLEIEKFSDFVEIGGSWWAKRRIVLDAKGRKTAETSYDITPLPQDKFDARLQSELAVRQSVQFIRHPLPKLGVARQRVADGSANFDDRIVMALHDSQSQQWDDLIAQLGEAEKLAAGKPGVRWLRTLAYATMRRNDEARLRLLDEAKRLAAASKPKGAAPQDAKFLADFILDQSQSVASPAELLAVLNVLKPVYEAEPAASGALADWQHRLANCYDSLSQAEKSLAIRKSLAENAPWDADEQIDFAQRLFQAGQAAAAYAWLDKQLALPEERLSANEESLRTAYADLYRKQTRWPDLLKFTTAWIARNPKSASAYEQHLSALIYNDQLDAANALAAQWLKEGEVDGKLSPPQSARLDAAISFADGNAYDVHLYRTRQQWFVPLADAARFFVRHDVHLDLAQQIMAGNFNNSGACDLLRADLFKLLQTDGKNLSPAQIGFLVAHTLSGRMDFAKPLDGRKQMDASEVPDELWLAIAQKLRVRWEKARDTAGNSGDIADRLMADKHQLGEAMRSIFSNRFAETKLLPFLRERIQKAPAELKPAYTAQLFDALLERKWTGAIEKEAFSLVPQVAGDSPPAARHFLQVAALVRLDDAMLANRMARAAEQLRDQGKLDKLTRTELATRYADFRHDALAGMAKRLAEQAAQAEKDKTPLADWLRIEQTYFDVRLDQNLAVAAAFCWSKLGAAPPQEKRAAEEEDSAESPPPNILDRILRARALATEMHLATRKDATAKSIERLVKYVDAGVAQGGDAAAAWRQVKFQLLIALDRPDDLERNLRTWIRADVSTAPWRKLLALLLAERGKLDEAIGLFEACQKDRLLSAADYRTLAGWYQAQGRRLDYEHARREAFRQMPESDLSDLIYTARNRWARDPSPPAKFDDDAILAFQTLFEKSAQPLEYIYGLRDIYRACRDSRLLQMLPDALPGRSPEQIYACLDQLRGYVLGEIRSEATADEILARIKKLRERKLTPIDLRALDLLEAIVERQSAGVLNQPRPHVEACLAAMKRAANRAWSPGEPRLMAGFLTNLGRLPDASLQAEQLRELHALQSAAAAHSRDHLLITADLCGLLFQQYGRKDEAMQMFQAEIRDYAQAQQDNWPLEDDDVLDQYANMLTHAGRYAQAELVWQAHLAHAAGDAQRQFFRDRLCTLYNLALAKRGEVSLGSGEKLFEALVAYGLRQIDAAADENGRERAVNGLVQTFVAAAGRRAVRNGDDPFSDSTPPKFAADQPALPGVEDALRAFAFEQLPPILKRQESQYGQTAQAPVGLIKDVLGPEDELRYVVDRMEQWPPHLQVTNQNAWRSLGSSLAETRCDASAAPADSSAGEVYKNLEPRVLKLVVAELKQYLLTGDGEEQSIYTAGSAGDRRYWSQKADDFAKAANEVRGEDKNSGREMKSIATYFWTGLQRRSRAIEILLIANDAGILDQSGQQQLGGYLQDQHRYAESIPVYQSLVKRKPGYMFFRTPLIVAYHASHRPEEMNELIADTDRFFHAGGRWNTMAIGQLADACLECKRFDRAIGYFHEAIAAREREYPGSGSGDGWLSGDYQSLARAQSALGHTREAVDAAAAAIVCWSPSSRERADAIDRLKDVLKSAKDLDAFVRSLDEESKKAGQDSPLVRRSIGEVYRSRHDYAKAIAQFNLARGLQPNDKATYQALIACYDAMKQPASATRELLALVGLDRHDLALYRQLVERLQADKPEAERAATSLVEAGPNDAENHQALAELRQRQNRWNEAIGQWQEVAELQRLEPSGLLKLAEAEIHERDWPAARRTLDKLSHTEWPRRFNDVESQIARLRATLPK